VSACCDLPARASDAGPEEEPSDDECERWAWEEFFRRDDGLEL